MLTETRVGALPVPPSSVRGRPPAALGGRACPRDAARGAGGDRVGARRDRGPDRAAAERVRLRGRAPGQRPGIGIL